MSVIFRVGKNGKTHLLHFAVEETGPERFSASLKDTVYKL